jgi:hypothetical protein
VKAPQLLCLAGLLATHLWGADFPFPEPLARERYAVMTEKSPFALATPSAPAAVAPTSFAAQWFVSGIGRLGDEYFVTIKARDLSTQFSLFGRQPHPENGVSVASVNWSEVIGKTSVILQRGTETAKLEFSETELRAPPSNAPTSAAAAPMVPQAFPRPSSMSPGMPPNFLPGMPSNLSPSPAAATPPVIIPTPPASQYPPTTAPPGTIQKRLHIIDRPREK